MHCACLLQLQHRLSRSQRTMQCCHTSNLYVNCWTTTLLMDLWTDARDIVADVATKGAVDRALLHECMAGTSHIRHEIKLWQTTAKLRSLEMTSTATTLLTSPSIMQQNTVAIAVARDHPSRKKGHPQFFCPRGLWLPVFACTQWRSHMMCQCLTQDRGP